MSAELLERYSGDIDTEDLMARCMGSIEFVNRILGVLVEQCSSEIAELELAVSNADVERVCTISHRLKGTLANASAKQMSNLADNICHASKQGRVTEAQDHLRKLRATWNDFSASVQDDLVAL